jgi:hypothetical protein
MGGPIARLRPVDRELQERIVEEARTCYAAAVPMSVAVARLVELAGDNPNAFQGVGGRGIRDLLGTPEGQAVLRLIGLADLTRRDQNPVGVQRVVGQKRTPEEENLASMSISDAFDLLTEQDPRLREIAHDVVDAAETARTNGEDYSSVRHAVDMVVIRAIRTIGQSATVQSALVSSATARQVVMSHLYRIADIRALDIESNDWPGGV